MVNVASNKNEVINWKNLIRAQFGDLPQDNVMTIPQTIISC